MTIIPTTLNPSDKGPNISLTGSNLTALDNNDGNASKQGVRSVFSTDSGKYYWEAVPTFAGYSRVGVGIATSSYSVNNELGAGVSEWAYFNQYVIHGTTKSVAYPVFESADVISVALDITEGKIWWALNGTWLDSGNPSVGTNPVYTGITGTVYAACGFYRYPDATDIISCLTNFGGSSFTYAVPSGFEAGFGEPIFESQITYPIKKTNQYNPFPILGGV